jgi:hypothetical protein
VLRGWVGNLASLAAVAVLAGVLGWRAWRKDTRRAAEVGRGQTR